MQISTRLAYEFGERTAVEVKAYLCNSTLVHVNSRKFMQVNPFLCS